MKTMRKHTIKQIRNMFFNEYPEFQRERRIGKKQEDYSCTCRCCFVDFVDSIHKRGMITDFQRFWITLG